MKKISILAILLLSSLNNLGFMHHDELRQEDLSFEEQEKKQKRHAIGITIGAIGAGIAAGSGAAAGAGVGVGTAAGVGAGVGAGAGAIIGGIVSGPALPAVIGVISIVYLIKSLKSKKEDKKSGGGGGGDDKDKDPKKDKDPDKDKDKHKLSVNGIYEANFKHTERSKPPVSKPPRRPQEALDRSAPTSKSDSRIAIEDKKFVVFKEHSPGKYHGYVVENFSDLRPHERNAFYDSGLVSNPKSGKIA